MAQIEYAEENWDNERWPNVGWKEVACRHTGTCSVDPVFIDRLQKLRDEYGKPIRITSGYRSPEHPVEAKKPGKTGAHTRGIAVDIQVSGHDAYLLLGIATQMNFAGIGLAQQGAPSERFIHLDDAEHEHVQPRPWVWTY